MSGPPDVARAPGARAVRRPPGYRGLPRPVRLAGWLLVCASVGGVIGLTGPTAIDGLVRLAVANPSILPWLAVRGLGFLAYLALAASVVYGLMLSTKLFDAVAHRPITIALHQDLSLAAVALTALHGALLVLDHSYSFTPLAVLVPFASPYAPLAVGVGQLAGYVALVVHASFHVRRRIGQRTWRMVHYASFLAYAGATAHGVASGTDSAAPWAYWMYVLPLAAVVFLFAYRLVGAAVAAFSPSTPVAAPPGRRQIGVPPRRVDIALD